jgi:uncharacterized protein YndB with AHSA1/START domain
MSDEKQLRVERTIDAPPERVFALLAEPDRHTELDGAGMLRGAEGGRGRVGAVGDVFFMNMHQDALGDYQMRNEIVAFEPDRRIGWAPSIHPPDGLSHVIGDLDPSGHNFIWELEPTGDGRTRVTHIYDWTAVTNPDALALYPVVSAEQLAGTLDRLAEATSAG